MKKIIYTILIGASLYSLVGCKKSVDEAKPSVSSRSEADDASARSELDKVYDDIEKVYNSQEYSDGSSLRTTGVILPCGSVTLNTKNFTIQYNGVNCGSRV